LKPINFYVRFPKPAVPLVPHDQLLNQPIQQFEN
jgi:hypothetical protein